MTGLTDWFRNWLGWKDDPDNPVMDAWEEQQLHDELVLAQSEGALPMVQAPVTAVVTEKVFRKKRKILDERGFIWVTACWDEVPIKDLEDQHLENIICMLKRWEVDPVEPTPEVIRRAMEYFNKQEEVLADWGAEREASFDGEKRRMSIMLYICLKEQANRKLLKLDGANSLSAGW